MTWHSHSPSKGQANSLSSRSGPDRHIIEELAVVPHARISETIIPTPSIRPPSTAFSPRHPYEQYPPYEALTSNTPSPTHERPLYRHCDTARRPVSSPGRYGNRNQHVGSYLPSPVSNGTKSRNSRMNEFMAKMEDLTGSSSRERIQRLAISPTKVKIKQHPRSFLFSNDSDSSVSHSSRPLFSAPPSLRNNTSSPSSRRRPKTRTVSTTNTISPYKYTPNFLHSKDDAVEDDFFFSADTVKSPSPSYRQGKVNPLLGLARPSTASSDSKTTNSSKDMFQYYPRLLSAATSLEDDEPEQEREQSSHGRNENIYVKQILRLNKQEPELQELERLGSGGLGVDDGVAEWSYLDQYDDGRDAADRYDRV
ncbi:hypothetical protein SeMB42_g01251 [Synchytrium endobioticum]|uniref:Uncharacterized protein n=1 Tax=Synchytrium endobioticum TaxID=286115 RepID=A0A507DBX9_9FUNG|nr:hypothetical protein SeLEV6574_g01657 [Synchytrium endobioticum]TPX52688.1 hypothetical protein SeMB42_g01251 [Synchytrium endobioticum]